MLNAVFVPAWEKHGLHDIAKADVLDVLRDIMERGKPSAARHAFATIRKFFNWCVEQELIETSPCLTIKPAAKANNRDRVLNDAELGRGPGVDVARPAPHGGDRHGAGGRAATRG